MILRINVVFHSNTLFFKNLNDDLQHAKALVCLLDKVPCRVNLIRFHAIPNVSLESSDLARMEAFRDTLNAAGIVVRSEHHEEKIYLRMRDAFYGEETTKRIEMVSFEGKEAIFV